MTTTQFLAIYIGGIAALFTAIAASEAYRRHHYNRSRRRHPSTPHPSRTRRHP